MSNNNFDYLYIEPKYLKADPTYQRDLSSSRVNAIVKNFDPNLFNEPKVSKRDDGFYYVFDGDHSIVAHKIYYGPDVPIKCKVYYGLTPEEEMNLFIQQNGISKNPTRIEKLRAMANYNDPDVTDMIESARVAGVSIDFKNLMPGTNRIVAIDTAFQVYKSIGRTNFINMLCVIKKSWGGSPESFSQGILKGFGYIYKHCSDQMARISNADLVNSFTGHPVSKIMERANVLTGNMGWRYALALSEQFNKRKKSKKIQLPEK